MKRQPRYSKSQKIGGRYLVHQALMGGMGEVYLCLDLKNNNPIALKTFQASSATLPQIFTNEVETWIALEKHPNIVRCFYMATLDSIPFMFLEWVVGDESHGPDLRSWLRHGALKLDLALRFTIDIVRGLKHAGEKVPGIVHRDLKPGNVLVSHSRQAKITDFGLATVVQRAELAITGSAEDASLGQSRRVGNMVGTPLYMSPEQWRGDEGQDFRTDLYAVGCILYELLTGHFVYTGRSINELALQHLQAPLPQLNGDFPAELTHILKGCLAKNRSNRFDSLDTLLVDLSRLYERQTGALPPEVSAKAFTAMEYSTRGATYTKLGQHEQALADYERAIALDPQDAMAYLNRGSTYATLGQHEQALVDYERAIALDPRYVGAYTNRGNSYAALGQHERALADYDRAVALGPQDALAYNNRGTCYTALGRHERALADYDRAIVLDPRYAGAFFSKGLDLGKRGYYAEAIPYFEKAAELGHPTGAQWAAKAREALQQARDGLSARSSIEQLLTLIFNIPSRDAMRVVVQQAPNLTHPQAIQMLEQAIHQVVPAQQTDLMLRIQWLKEIAKDVSP